MMHYNSYLFMFINAHLVYIVFKSVLMFVITWHIHWLPFGYLYYIYIYIYKTIFIINTCNILMISVGASLYSKMPSKSVVQWE